MVWEFCGQRRGCWRTGQSVNTKNKTKLLRVVNKVMFVLKSTDLDTVLLQGTCVEVNLEPTARNHVLLSGLDPNSRIGATPTSLSLSRCCPLPDKCLGL